MDRDITSSPQDEIRKCCGEDTCRLVSPVQFAREHRAIWVAPQDSGDMSAMSSESLAMREAVMARRDTVDEILSRYAATNPRLFGSVARGEASDRSDLDLLVHRRKLGSQVRERYLAVGVVDERDNSCSTARRIHAETERSSASAARLTSSSRSAGNRTGTGVLIGRFRRRAGPWGSWLAGSA